MTAIDATASPSSTMPLIGGPDNGLRGRISGVVVEFLVTFLDLGITHSPMLRPAPAPSVKARPGRGRTKPVADTARIAHFDQAGPLLVGRARLGGLSVAGRGRPRARRHSDGSRRTLASCAESVGGPHCGPARFDGVESLFKYVLFSPTQWRSIDTFHQDATGFENAERGQPNSVPRDVVRAQEGNHHGRRPL